MADKANGPVDVRLSLDIEYRSDRPAPYRARVRWTDPTSKRHQSLSEGKDSEEEAQEWLQAIIEAAQADLRPSLTTMKLAEYGEAGMDLALRVLELKTLVPTCLGGGCASSPPWAIAVRMITNVVVDRIIKVNPAPVTGWQKLYKQTENELLSPGALGPARPGDPHCTGRRAHCRLPRPISLLGKHGSHPAQDRPPRLPGHPPGATCNPTYTKSQPPGWRSPQTSACCAHHAHCRARTL
ncbi:hypothetical protein ACFRH6_32535 [Streptomyces sp. NPDC056749]|uniref:hypothetical protein n=1 Tax=Streptomyces sp. NPDC056749 TaxID=3345936 RepID=UPI00368C9C68